MLSNFFFNLIQKFISFKRSRFYHFIKSIIFPFVIKNVSKLFNSKINENLIVMGAYGGGGFVDNTKYLFEFLNKKSKYTLVWIAKLKSVRKLLREIGFNVVSMYSLQAIKILRRAKYIFITHNYEDILPIEFSNGSTIILTWHGLPIKNVEVNLKESFIYNKWGDIFHLKLKNDDYIDYLLSQSSNENDVNILSSQLKIAPNKIISLGYPRNDILFNKNDKLIENIKNNYDIPYNVQQVFLYAPTFRSNRTFTLPLSESDIINLNKILKEINSILILKPHMITERVRFENYENIKVLDKKTDFQELLLISDVLISDYSGAWIDYLLTLKPILIFTYDLNNYRKKKGLNYNLNDIAPGPILYNANELFDAIKNIDIIDKNYKQKREEIRDRFNDFKDGDSTKRILDFLKIKYE
ncbi:MAG: CDP-glycerol glycerophosphotransferase family protein [Promethearchaeota archaeon]